ncbi:unnamed protein product, partial [Ectocarpus sp. 13 AM-2016]
MVDIMKRMERNRTENHAEILRVLKALRYDERSELTAWDEIDYDKDLDFEGSTRLGSGGFGEVRTAKWNGSDVAVKRLLADGLDRDDVRALRKEVCIHANLHFDHVVQLYAAYTIAPNLCLVVEFASEGSLRQYLSSTNEPLAHALQTAFLFDIARGMWYLHKKGIWHRDLKSANVLIFANGRLKLCDFGLSKIMAESSKRSIQGAVGAEQWIAQQMNERTYTVVNAVAWQGQRPQIPEWASAPPDIVPLMEQCWTQDPAHRPKGFGPVVQTLASVVSRDGDPSNRSAVDVDDTSSSGVKRSGGSPNIDTRTTPATGSDGADASPRGAEKESGATALPPEAENVHAPIVDLPIVRQALAPSSGSSGEFHQGTETVDEKFSMK